MLVLLPFLILGVGVSCGICAAGSYAGLRLAAMLVLCFAAAFAAGLILFVLFLGLLSLFADRKKPQERPNRFYSAVVTYGCGLLVTLGRIRLRVSGTERIPGGNWLLVCNHRSNFDPIVTIWGLRAYPMVFISKPRNLELPIVGALLCKAGHLAIDRENDRAALRTVLTAAERLKAGDCSVAVYPEGTRNPAPEMLPFRNGAFKVAQKAGRPIVVASVQGTDEVTHRFPWRRTEISLHICGVMDAETVSRLKTVEIGEEVRACIQRDLAGEP